MTILCSNDDLDLGHTLMSGQAFRWQTDGDVWSCALIDRSTVTLPVLLRLESGADGISHVSVPQVGSLAARYFRLDMDLTAMLSAFRSSDPDLAATLDMFRGLRVLRQDPVECLFSFICTSAAPLHRIRTGIDRFCRAYGDRMEVDDGVHFVFPSVEQLAAADVDRLRSMGLGYRARYIQQAAGEVLARGGEEWLVSLRDAPYVDAKRELVGLTGVGEKIADCVCLFSLDKDEAVPVDTHVRQIAARYPEIGETSSYSRIADGLRDRFGPLAGWAQQYLFFGDLYQRGTWGAYARQYGSGSDTEAS